ncbi:MAG: hypothetical protein HYT39_00450 [Candidatus Sungbacteria bacterium]|nr:hypothetical protein [Candidatus Sungbacteria bacterium]
MSKKFLFASSIIILAVGYGTFEFLRPPEVVVIGRTPEAADETKPQKTVEERVAEAKAHSQNVKGLYVTAAVANDQGRPASHLRNEILRLADTTEINAVVIDVKETQGPEMTSNLKPFLDVLKSKNIWRIARVATFRDNSKIATHPEYYLKRADGKIWRDDKGNAWMDPMATGTRNYILDFSQRVIDRGFDELQFDYVRFPSDGDTKTIVYPAYDKKVMDKPTALKSFFAFLHDNLKSYKPEIILSGDLFGYVAIEKEDFGVGQRLEDVGASFDYISPMLYPSHFYSGFYAAKDVYRNLPSLYFPYRGSPTSTLVSARPFDVVYRSLFMAQDILAGRDSATTSTSSLAVVSEKPQALLRPWLQDFDLGVDTSRGIYYDMNAVRAQIDAAERAGSSGWLLWSPDNVYTEAALRKE